MLLEALGACTGDSVYSAIQTPCAPNFKLFPNDALVLVWTGHGGQISHVPDRLEVATAKKEIHLLPCLALCILNGRVDVVQLPVAATFDSNLD